MRASARLTGGDPPPSYDCKPAWIAPTDSGALITIIVTPKQFDELDGSWSRWHSWNSWKSESWDSKAKHDWRNYDRFGGWGNWSVPREQKYPGSRGAQKPIDPNHKRGRAAGKSKKAMASMHNACEMMGCDIDLKDAGGPRDVAERYHHMRSNTLVVRQQEVHHHYHGQADMASMALAERCGVLQGRLEAMEMQHYGYTPGKASGSHGRPALDRRRQWWEDSDDEPSDSHENHGQPPAPMELEVGSEEVPPSTPSVPVAWAPETPAPATPLPGQPQAPYASWREYFEAS